MLTFSINRVVGTDAYSAKVQNTINSNIGYFKTFNGASWEEAAQKTFVYALEHRKAEYQEDLTPYIKKLARTILRKSGNTESIYSITTDDGEIAPVFLGLQDHIDTENLDGNQALLDTFKELYLIDSDSFNRLKLMFQYDAPDEIENLKDLRVRNPKITEEISKMLLKHGSDYTFRSLFQFFQMLPSLVEVRETHLTKEVLIREGNFSVLERIPNTPSIVDNNGRYHYIDKITLTMDSNPDYYKWDIIGTSLCDILKIDFSEYMNYMYEEVFVEQGVSTRHIQWCGDKYKVTTPGGTEYLGLEFDKFLNTVRIELLLNLIESNVGSIIAISPDNLYVKPTRTFQFDTIRVKCQSGKIFDLPITIHIKKRKK